MPVIDTNYILIPGAGTLLWQTYTTTLANQFKSMRTFGGTGGVKITTTRETLDYDEGTPASNVVRDVVKESGNVEILLIEKTLEDLVVELGYGTVTTVNATLANDTNYTLWLRSTGWQLVGEVRYDMYNTVVVTSVDATPVTYDLDQDYQIGQVEGTLAIARLSGGDITDGEQVTVAVNYDTPAQKSLTMGGSNTISYVHLMHIKTLRDGVKREVTKVYKAGIAGDVVEDFPKSAHAERTVNFAMLADSTRTAGDRLWVKTQDTE